MNTVSSARSHTRANLANAHTLAPFFTSNSDRRLGAKATGRSL